MGLAKIIEQYATDGLFTHAYAAVFSLKEERPRAEYAHLPDGRDIFDLASLTKALVTTPLIFAELEAGALTLDMDLASYLGDAAGDLDPRLLRLHVRELLAHSSGLPAWRCFWMCCLGVVPDERLFEPGFRLQRFLLALNRAAEAMLPSQGQIYSDVGFILLGLALEKKRRVNIENLFINFKNKIMFSEEHDLMFRPRKDDVPRCIETGMCLVRGRNLIGEVHDENCASLGGVAGHAGLFGSGPGLCRFLRVLLTSPVGQRLYRENAAARVLPVVAPANEGLLGWRQGGDVSSLPFGHGEALGHLGFTGVAFWVWPQTDSCAVLLTNRVVSGRTKTTAKAGISALRRDVFQELAKSVKVP